MIGSRFTLATSQRFDNYGSICSDPIEAVRRLVNEAKGFRRVRVPSAVWHVIQAHPVFAERVKSAATMPRLRLALGSFLFEWWGGAVKDRAVFADAIGVPRHALKIGGPGRDVVIEGRVGAMIENCIEARTLTA